MRFVFQVFSVFFEEFGVENGVEKEIRKRKTPAGMVGVFFVLCYPDLISL